MKTIAQEKRSTADWIAGLKPGDEVCVQLGYNSEPSIRKVERITATQVLVSEAHSTIVTRFRKVDGYAVGSSRAMWHRSRIVEPTPALREEARRAQALFRIGCVKWKGVPTEKIEKALAAIEEV